MALLLFYFLFVVLWIKRKRALSIAFLYAAITNGFNFKGIATNYDLTYLSFAAGSIGVINYLCKKDINLIHLNVENCVVWLYCFIGIHAFVTAALGIDTFKYSFIVFRQWGLIGIFLFFKSLNTEEIEKTFKYLLVINSIWLVLYYLQFWGINLFIEERFITSFKRNTPVLSLFFAIYVLYTYHSWWKWLLILPFFWTFVTAGTRGSGTGLVIAFFVFYALVKKSKKIIVYGLIFLLCQSYVSSFLQSDTFSRNGNLTFLEELGRGFDTNYRNFHGTSTDGTFAYRTLYLVERIDYLLNNPEYLLLGIGSIYEASPNNNMHFYVQTSGRIETDDLFWAAPLLRYGILGISLYILFFISYFNFFAKQNLNGRMEKIGLIFFLLLLFTSMSTWSFTVVPNIMCMGLCFYRIKNNTKSTQTKMICSKKD